MSDVLPCMSVSARTIRPPKTSPIAWWPRQTPRIGRRPANASTARGDSPARDRRAERTGEAGVEDAARVGPAPARLERIDDLHGADLGGAAHGPRGKAGQERVEGIVPFPKARFER